MDELKKERRVKSKEIATIKKVRRFSKIRACTELVWRIQSGGDPAEALASVQTYKDKIQNAEGFKTALEQQIKGKINLIGNYVHDSVVVSDNEVLDMFRLQLYCVQLLTV